MAAAKKLTAKQELEVVRQAVAGLTDRLRALGEENAELRLNAGPRCNHSPEGPDERNVRLLQAQGQTVSRLIWERDDAIQRYNEIERYETALRDEWRHRMKTFKRREQDEWKRVWSEVDLWLTQQGVPDPAAFYRARKAELEGNG